MRRRETPRPSSPPGRKHGRGNESREHGCSWQVGLGGRSRFGRIATQRTLRLARRKSHVSSLTRGATEARANRYDGRREGSLNGHLLAARHAATQVVARPNTTEGVAVRSPSSLTGWRQLSNLVLRVERRIGPQGTAVSSLSIGVEERVLVKRQATSDVGQGIRRERLLQLAKARGVGSPEDGARASSTKVEHRFPVHEGWRR